jgi:hypothetical protein
LRKNGHHLVEPQAAAKNGKVVDRIWKQTAKASSARKAAVAD